MTELCKKCRLWKTSQTGNGLYSCNKLMGVGLDNAEIMFVGDWPSDAEIQKKQPFVGLAGQVLKSVLSSVGFDINLCFFTYLCKCKPSYEKAPTRVEMNACLEYLHNEILRINPKVIVALGGTVASMFKITGSISNIHGQVFKYNIVNNGGSEYSFDVVPIYHPTYVNNFVEHSKQRKDFSQDIGKILRLIKGQRDHSTIKVDYRVAKTIEDVKEFVDILLKSDWVSYDSETTSLDCLKGEILLTSFSDKPGRAFVIPYKYPGVFTKEEQEIVKIELGRILGSTVKKIMQNGKFDIQFLFADNIPIKMFAFDTMLAHYLLDENSSHGLGNIVPIYTDMGHYKDQVGEYIKGAIKIKVGVNDKGKDIVRNSTILDCPYDMLIKYAAQDADATFRLFKTFYKLLQEEDLLKLLLKVVNPVSYVLAQMEFTGVKGDLEYVKRAVEKYNKEMVALDNVIQESRYVKQYLQKYNNKDGRFNIQSVKQKRELLFDIMGLVPIKINKLTNKQREKGLKQGSESVDADALQQLYQKNKIKVLDDILKYTKAKKFSEYVESYKKLLEESVDGRIHTCYNQTITATGRLSSSSPNLQNIPKHDKEKAKIVRSTFIASPGYTLVEADFSQIEFRIWGHVSKDEKLLELLRTGFDIHYQIAASILKIPIEKVTKEQRSAVKGVVYGTMYGRSTYSIAKELGIEEQEAQRFVNGFFLTFPKATSYMEDNIAHLEKYGYVKNFYGRRRRALDIYSKIKTAKEAAQRQARNAPIQSGAADVMYQVMIKVYRELLKYDAKMLMQIHDSLVFEINDNQISVVLPLIKRVMETAVPLDCPVTVGVDLGKTLGDMREVQFTDTSINIEDGVDGVGKKRFKELCKITGI